ncbi:hypothetical protein [Schlesneria paludicola]|uniref:hypothetical protein n=1 Tax=Schlesneria paludicola TaxID=360056 RepID=UPI00029A251A|nr:hypothetical protein [Schlesneria paludicola]
MAYRPSGLFRTRNILAGALIAGIFLGAYLGDKLGFGTGGAGIFGLGKSGDSAPADSKPGKTQDDATTENAPAVPVLEATAPKAVRVMIDDRQYLLREGNQDTPITLPKLISLIKQAPGDDDGFRVRIYQSMNARVSAEEQLKDALTEAHISDTAVFWVPSTVSK